MSSFGSRLPGDSEQNDCHRSEECAEARLSGDLAARFTDCVDVHTESKSEVGREALDKSFPASERSGYVLPKDHDLANGYLALSDDEARTVSVEVAEDIV